MCVRIQFIYLFSPQIPGCGAIHWSTANLSRASSLESHDLLILLYQGTEAQFYKCAEKKNKYQIYLAL